MKEPIFQGWIDNLKNEIQEHQALEVDDRTKLFLLHKLGQNLLSLAANINLEDKYEDLVSSNLMVHVPEQKVLRIVLTHGFYYRDPFRRSFSTETSSVQGGADTGGTCGEAFRTGEFIFVDDAHNDPRVIWSKDIPKTHENVGSIINVPLAKFGVLNIDSQTSGLFTPHALYNPRIAALQNLGVSYMKLYTVANPFLEQYRPVSMRTDSVGPPEQIRSDVLKDLALIERCLILSIFDAAAIVARRVAERICAQMGQTPNRQKQLGTVIKELLVSRKIDEQMSQRLQEIAKLGNSVAHVSLGAQLTRDDSRRAFQLAQEAAAIAFGHNP